MTMDLSFAARIVADLVAEGLLSERGGNVSFRENGEGFWITAAGRPKDALTAADWAHLGPDGAARTAGLEPSSEWRVHAAIYRLRPGVGAVIHGHAPAGLAWSSATDRLPCVHTETALLGPVAALPWVEPGDERLAVVVAEALAGAELPDAVLLRNHGFVAVGRDFAAAATAARVLERSARIALDARAAHGSVAELDPQTAAGLRARYGGFSGSTDT